MDRRLFCGVLLCGTCLSAPALSQTVTDAIPPQRRNLDANFVDRATGAVSVPYPVLAIGPSGRRGLSVTGFAGASGSRADNGGAAGGASTNWGLVIYKSSDNLTYSVGLGETVDIFARSGNNFSSKMPNGATLTVSGNAYTYTAGDGTVILYNNTLFATVETNRAARATKITYPTGEVVTLAWAQSYFCPGFQDTCTGSQKTFQVRLQSVSSSLSYQLRYVYDADDIYSNADVNAWNRLDSIQTLNTSLDAAHQVVATMQFSFTAATGTEQIVDPAGRAYSYKINNAAVSVQTPGHTSPNLIYTLTNDVVSQVVRDGITYSYSQSVADGIRTVTVTDPRQQMSHTTADTAQYQILGSTDGRTHTTTNTWDPTTHLLTMTTYPDGNSIEYRYDARGNVTQTIQHAKPGTSLPDISTYADYPTTCSAVATCNQPTATRDGNGKQTDYQYAAGTGYVTSVMAPADSSGVRPEVRYSYGQVQAQTMTSSGSLQPSGLPVWLPSTVSTCRSGTAPGCVNTAAETRIFYSSYDNNLLNTSIQAGVGGGAPIATTTMSYDASGTLRTSTDANSNATRYLYDADRELVGAIGPDPDGAGTGNWGQAVRISYGANGKVSLVEQGTAPGQTDADWQNFSSHRQVATGYDANDRKSIDRVQAGGTTFALTQYSYDNNGRLDCTALRMNPAVYGSTLPDACTLGTAGSYGPDRIGRTEYSPTDQVTKSWTGYRSPGASAVVYDYSANGRLTTLLDGNMNLTTNVYDGLDRLYQVQFPDPATKKTSSASDYAQYGYDNNGNLTFRFLRGTGDGISYGYDALNRLISKTPSGSEGNPIRARTFAYDLVGNMTQARFTASGLAVTMSYDALDRRVSESWPQGNSTNPGASVLYDAGGRRTRLTWPDGNYVTYQYDHAGHVNGVYENGGTLLAALGYDDDGRRTALCFANRSDMCTQYGYDAVSGLNALNVSPGGSAGTNIAFGTRDPAGGIVQRGSTNTAYAFTQTANAGRSYAVNGLNQYTGVTGGGGAIGYDAHGNLTSFNGNTYTYDGENLMVATSVNSVALSYDPLNRLTNVQRSGLPATLFQYDGDDNIASYDSSNALLRRWVFLPGGGDEPIVWYEGATLTNKRYLQSDERGSIVRVADGTNTTIATNSYDDFGMPATTNQDRFQYTGQAWIGNIGLYYYKARFYNPTLGRFMSADPIGYEGGINLYNYVGSDPVNGADATGLQCHTAGLEGYSNATICDSGVFIGGAGSGSVGSSGELTARLDRNLKAQRQKPDPCATVAVQKGTIRYTGTTVSVIFGGGLSRTSGTFTNLATGSHGSFVSYGAGIGLGLGVGRTTGYYRSASDFLGYSETLEASLSLADSALSVSGSVTENANGDVTALNAGVSLSAPSPIPGAFGRAGLTATASDTSISQCTVGK